MLKNWICESSFLPFSKCYKIFICDNCLVEDGKGYGPKEDSTKDQLQGGVHHWLAHTY